MTIAKAVAKARRELKKIINSDYARLSNEDFRKDKLRRFIERYVNTKGHTDIYYHRENGLVEKELNDILTWDRSQLNIYDTH